MALDCNLHEVVFVLLCTAADRPYLIDMAVINAHGELVARDRSKLRDVPRVLRPWLSRMGTRIKFVCSLLTSFDQTVFARYMHEHGYYDVAYNGVAYTSLLPDALVQKSRDDLHDVAEFFGAHIVESTDDQFMRHQRIPVYVACTYNKPSGISIAAGTIERGVEIAVPAHYASDICEALLPWFTKQACYQLFFVANYSTRYSRESVDKALGRRGYSLSKLPLVTLSDPDERLGRFFLTMADAPGFNFARCVLDAFIVEQRCNKPSHSCSS